MFPSTQILTCFRFYNALLENGISSVLELFRVSGNQDFRTIPNDKSVRTTSELGSRVIECMAHEEELRKSFSQMEETFKSIDSRCYVLLTECYCHSFTKAETQTASG